MLRINHAGNRTVSTLALDGKLIGPWVGELRRAVSALQGDMSVCLNLAHLNYADGDGLRLLKELRREGVQFIDVSPLIDGLLSLTSGPSSDHAQSSVHQ